MHDDFPFSDSVFINLERARKKEECAGAADLSDVVVMEIIFPTSSALPPQTSEDIFCLH
jgi:hypothetical protein